MAVALVGPSAPNSPLAVQAQAPDLRDTPSDVKRVTPVDETRSTDRDARALAEDRTDQNRSERSGQFANTGTQGTRGGEPGLLSRGPSSDTDRTRDTRTSSAERPDAVSEAAIRSRSAPQNNAVEDAKPVVARIEIQNPALDGLKTQMFITRLDEIRSPDEASSSEQTTRDTSEAGTPADAAEISTGRFDKRA